MRQKRIQIDGKNISYYETGEHKHPVVFVHDLSMSSSFFVRQLIDSVLSYQYRFIAPDLIGHGKTDHSDYPERDYTLKGLSDFFIRFNNELNLEKAIYVGHGFGANIILEAFNHLKKPLGLVLLGSTPLNNPFTNELFINPEIIQLFSKAGIDDSEIHQLSGYFVEENTKYPDFIPEIIRKADLQTRELFFKSIQKGDYKDQLQIMKEINVPVAVYYGEFDQIYNFDYLNSIEIPTIWRSIIQIIGDSGHIFFYENPADFNISFEAFLTSVF